MKESQNWYVRRGDKVKGPYPVGLIARYLLLGRLHDLDFVSHDREQWQRIVSMPEMIPEVLRQARANPDDPEAQERLAAARRWADEREESEESTIDVGERRRNDDPAENVALRAAHKSRKRTFDPTMVSTSDYLVIAIIILVLVAVALVLPIHSSSSGPECDAAPAPHVNWNNCHLEAKQFPNSNLAGAKMRNASLAGAVLRAADLSEADLAYASLTLANLRGANLRGASLKGATLRKADLTNANLEGADLSYADLTDAVLDGAVLTGATFDHAVWAPGVECLPGSVGGCNPARPAH